MDRWFDVGQEAEGFIAIGQMATGVIAIGQMAHGVIAIGQVARGVVAIGQVSLGIFTVGMASAGVVYTVALVGVAGVAGPGLVIPLVPTLPKRPRFPSTVSAAALRAGTVVAGWLRIRLEPLGKDDLRVLHDREELPVRFARRLWDTARSRASGSQQRVLAFIERRDDELICSRLMDIPRRKRIGCVLSLIQFGALCGLCVAFWIGVVLPLAQALLD